MFMDLQSFSYADINNNTFRGDPQRLSYRPIQAKESSSGVYSGGEAKDLDLQADQWETVQDLIKAIIDNESIHLEQRRMLTTRLFVSRAGESQSWIIRRSEEQAALDTFLRQVLGL